MVKRYRLECLGEDVVMVVDGQRVMFEGWDEDAEEAWVALGGERSICSNVAYAFKHQILDIYLEAAAVNGNAEEVRALIAAGAPAISWHREPLIRAVERGHAEVVEVLLEKGGFPGGWEGYLQRKVIQNKHYDVAQIIKDHAKRYWRRW